MATSSKIQAQQDREPEAGEQSPRICFLHIPKCGGTTIQVALERHFGPHSSFRLNARDSLARAREAGAPPLAFRRRQLSSYLAEPERRCVTGHFPFSEAAHRGFSHRWRFITLLREPVSRWFSQYFYNRYKESDHYKTELDLETFLARAPRSKAYSNMLADVPRYQVWKRPTPTAIKTLERLDVVGCLEHLDDFRCEVERLLGADLQIGHERHNPLPVEDQQRMITPAIRRRVEELCVDDSKIYRHALKLVEQRATDRSS